MTVPTVSELLHYWTLDEPYEGSNAVNYGSNTLALTPYGEDAGGSVVCNRTLKTSDGRGGWAWHFGTIVLPGNDAAFTYFTHKTTQDTVPNLITAGLHPAAPAVGEGFSYGCRFRIPALAGNSGYYHPIFGCLEADHSPPNNYSMGAAALYSSGSGTWGITVHVNGVIKSCDSSETGVTLDQGAWGSATSAYWLPTGQWFTMVVSSKRTGASAYRIYVMLKNDDTGDWFSFYFTASTLGTAWTAGDDYRWMVAMPESQQTALFGEFKGDVDDCWVHTEYLEDVDVLALGHTGLTVEWSPPSYRRVSHSIYTAVADEAHDFPMTRALPLGATVARHPCDRFCNEVRTRVEGWRPGRPWALQAIDYLWDVAGPYAGKHGQRTRVQAINAGLWRSPGPKPPGALQDVLNVVYSEQGPRRRRGVKVRRDVSTSYAYALNCFRSWRAWDDQLFLLYKVGDALYGESGTTTPISLDTGWHGYQIPGTLLLDNRLVILSQTKRKVWDGGASLGDLSLAGPTSISAAAATGGTLTGTFYYAVTYYDPTTGDETGAAFSGAVSPSTQKVRVTITGSAPETRFSQIRVYRTSNGGSAPNLFLVVTATAAAYYDDTGLANGTQLLGQVTDTGGTLLGYITSTAPATFWHGIVHRERAFYIDKDNPQRVYWSEAGKFNRWYSGSWIDAEGGPVQALASWQGRLLVFTRNTVEVVDSDFVRDGDGLVNLQRITMTYNLGCVGPHAVVAYGSEIVWLDRRGVFTLQGSSCIPLSDRIKDLFPYLNHSLTKWASGGWNPVRREVWFTLPFSTQTDNTRFQRQLAFDPSVPDKWTIHDLEASYIAQFDDDQAGLKFGLIDHAGVFKECEAYEGDGAQGNESYTTESDGDDSSPHTTGVKTVTGSVIEVYGTPGWTTNALRGFHVVLRDRSTGALFTYLIVSNTATTFTVERTPDTSITAGDGWYLGGIRAYLEYAGMDLESPNRKVIRQVQYQFTDLTQTDLYL